ncbi:3-isopropylmalate dehydrogenase, chloroplastic [Capsicum chinense]|nr:3-isopropylmalate dehydrogenase, chloroplastic [Capsicum chinense]
MAFQIARRFLGGGGNSVALSIRYLGRTFASAASESNLIRATLFPGDGIGPEIAESVKQVLVLRGILFGVVAILYLIGIRLLTLERTPKLD